MRKRIYVCHTYYHLYMTCLKELFLPKEEQGQAELILSRLSSDFGDMDERARKCGLFAKVYWLDEKRDSFFPQLEKYRKDRGNLLINMAARIIFTKKFGKLQEPYMPVDFKQYDDIYVFCDADPIGYYLSYKKIYYHALDDGPNSTQYCDEARYDNRGHFEIKAWFAAHNLIFIRNGYAKYCMDMEVNDISKLRFPHNKYIEQSIAELEEHLSEEDKGLLINLFIANMEELRQKLNSSSADKILVLTEPLCDLEVRKRIFADIIKDYGEENGKKYQVLIKPHPRDLVDYVKEFPEHIVLEGKFPMEILNFLPNVRFKKVISVFTVPDMIRFADEIVYLGEDFMDKYEAPEIHRQNEYM
ncbi:MAG: glycosyltransferase family 52 protein [Butyrivibrio sp.]|nr:glycosyltransferase family 52 protein [Butyrivibrio sp.]